MEHLDIERLKFLLAYDPDTGVFTWRVRRGGKANPGARSECLDSKGYYRIGIDGRRYLAHRLAWFYVYGVWPDGLLDHVNRDRTDNRIVNLRVVSTVGNAWNRSKSEKHSNPHIGVSNTYAGTDRPWAAYITRHKKRVLLGRFAGIEEAVAARREAELRAELPVLSS